MRAATFSGSVGTVHGACVPEGILGVVGIVGVLLLVLLQLEGWLAALAAAAVAAVLVVCCSSLIISGDFRFTHVAIACMCTRAQGLREEFELDSRFRKIEFKLNMLQQNTNFFIEMLHNQKR